MSFHPPPITARERPHLEVMGSRLAELRIAAGLTQRALSERTGISAGQVSSIERAKSRTRRSTLALLARALDPEREVSLTAELAEMAGPGLARESKMTREVALFQEEALTLGSAEAIRRHSDRIGLTALRTKLDRALSVPPSVAETER